MTRTMSLKKLYQKTFTTFAFVGAWLATMATPETSGIWMIWGAEKNGKTWFALKLAEYLATFTKVLYISGEEGLGYDFLEAIKRAKVDVNNAQLRFCEYTPIAELAELLAKRNAPKVVVIDNITCYADELKGNTLRKLTAKHPDVLFIYLAHEENKVPYTAVAKLCRKYARIIMHIQGLQASVSGRCPGGTLVVDENQAQIYWGTQQP
jgi:hypothetical protein